ncbi:MAG: Citrate lyase acyl carrier protein [bacterium]|nr:Citrate lyase acyl carrier protein [bacterium]MCK6562924.1 aldolase/citrate lyase family protein [bacterium]NUM65583.1 citrate lyase ACP [candidate division KSB1 bacterium]
MNTDSPRHRRGHAGKQGESVRSDCLVEIELQPAGGMQIALTSKVAALYGEAIAELARAVAAQAGVAHARLTIVDSGALPFTLAARLEAACRAVLGEEEFEYLPAAPLIPHAPTQKDRLRRTRLYLPGNEPKFFVNAGLHQPDAVILDLEDSVAPQEKEAARVLVRNALRCVDFFGAERMVRINAGELGRQDLAAVVPQGAQVILIPKCESPQRVSDIAAEVERLRQAHGRAHEVYLIPIIESALGVIKAFAIATASDKVCALALGLEDYTADLGVPRTAAETESFFAKGAIVNAARAAGVQALASVYSDVDNVDGLRANVQAARALGFDGLGCIHPRQIKIVHEAIAPGAAEINQARQIVLTFEQAQQQGTAVFALGTKMIDLPVVKRAQATLANALAAGRLSADWRTQTPHENKLA